MPADSSTASPITALVRRYVKRRNASTLALSRATGREERTIRLLLAGETTGLKPWQGEALLSIVARELEIPERELRKAIADHYQAQAADSLLAATKSAKDAARRASKRCYAYSALEQPELALAASY